jgi:serine/threonine-protein kinase
MDAILPLDWAEWIEGLEPLGRSPHAVSWAARRRVDGRPLIIKALHRADCFDRHAPRLPEIRHPHLVEVLAVAPMGWLVLARVPGRSLAEAPAEACRVLPAVLDAVAAIHRAGVTHLNLHPGNIHVGAAPMVMEPMTGHAPLPYAAPERLRGARPDARADVWALGILAYRLLVGHAPFAGTKAALACQVVSDAPPPPRLLAPELTGCLEAWLTRALAREPDARFAHAGEMLEAWRACARPALARAA